MRFRTYPKGIMSFQDWSQDSAHPEFDATNQASVGASSHLPEVDAHSQPSSTCEDALRDVSNGVPVADEVRVSSDSAWDFSRQLSPRRYVRVREWDGKRFAYKDRRYLSASAPSTAWAVHLTDQDEQFAFLAFDFDAKPPTPKEHSQYAARADADTSRLVQLLTAHGIGHTVCASGPGAGRHVWVALADRLPLDTVKHLARSLKQLCESLDTAPISNARRGLVRPPGAPHYDGGRSRWIAGAHPESLLTPSATAAQIAALTADVDELAAEALAARLSAPAPDRRSAGDLDLTELRPDGPLPVAIAADGAPHLPGARRPLPRRIIDRANTPLRPHEDGSAEQFRILCAAAACRWTYAQVLAELAHLPGMEHARTIRVDGGRVPRTPEAQAAGLLEDWRRAVARVSRRSAPRREHTGPTDLGFEEDAAAVCAAVEHLRLRADLSCGRWSSPTGAIDRLVLATLMRIAVDSVKTVIAASTRTVAIRTVCIGRESARESLQRLARDGWIGLHAEAVGTAAAEWELLPHGPEVPTQTPATTCEKNDEPEVIHRESSSSRSHQLTRAGAPPSPAPISGSARLAELRSRYRKEQELSGHDCFTADSYGGLGAAAAWVYSQLPTTPISREDLSIAGFPRADTDKALETLYAAGLVTTTAQGISRTDPAARDAYAQYVGLSGLAAARAEQYAIESEVWAWWCSEEHVVAAHAAALQRSGPDSSRARIRDGQQTLELGTTPAWAALPPYPRGRLGRPNHRAAYAFIARRRERQRLDGAA